MTQILFVWQKNKWFNLHYSMFLCENVADHFHFHFYCNKQKKVGNCFHCRADWRLPAQHQTADIYLSHQHFENAQLKGCNCWTGQTNMPCVVCLTMGCLSCHPDGLKIGLIVSLSTCHRGHSCGALLYGPGVWTGEHGEVRPDQHSGHDVMWWAWNSSFIYTDPSLCFISFLSFRFYLYC